MSVNTYNPVAYLPSSYYKFTTTESSWNKYFTHSPSDCPPSSVKDGKYVFGQRDHEEKYVDLGTAFERFRSKHPTCAPTHEWSETPSTCSGVGKLVTNSYVDGYPRRSRPKRKNDLYFNANAANLRNDHSLYMNGYMPAAPVPQEGCVTNLVREV